MQEQIPSNTTKKYNNFFTSLISLMNFYRLPIEVIASNIWMD